MKISEQQKFSDILELLTYIKANIHPSMQIERGVELDTIATTTRDIITALSDMNTRLTVSQATLLDPYLSQFDQATDHLKGSLETLVTTISSNTASQEELNQSIAQAHNKYIASIFEMSERVQEQIAHQDEKYAAITGELEKLFSEIKGLDAKILTETMLTGILDTLSVRIDEMRESDKRFEQSSKASLEVIGGQLTTATNLAKTISESLDNIGESCTQSNSRLAIVEVKVDVILETLTEGQ